MKPVVRGLATADALPSPTYVPPILIATITCQWTDLQATLGGPILASNPIDAALAWAAAAPLGQTRYVRSRVLVNSAANIPSWVLDADGAHMNIVTYDTPGGINVARWWVAGGNFRNYYADLMTKLGAAYDSNPAFALMFATMTMVEWGEPLMRFWARGANAATYTAAGYTVAKDKAAIHDCFTIHAAAFPNTPTGFAYNPYDGGGGSVNPVFAMTDQVATLGSDTQLQNNSMGNSGSATTAYTNMYDSMAAAGGHLSFQLCAPANLAAGQTYYSASQTALGYGATLIEVNGPPSLMTTPQLDEIDSLLRGTTGWTPGWSLSGLKQGSLVGRRTATMQNHAVWGTSAEAVQVAQECCFISGPTNLPFLAAMMRANPALIFAPYLKSIQNPASVDSAHTLYPAKWYMHYMNGAFVEQTGTFVNWLMETGKWTEAHAAATVKGPLSKVSISASMFGEHHVKDAVAMIDQLNALIANAGLHPWRAMWVDSNDTFSEDAAPGFWGTTNPGKNPHTGLAYTRTDVLAQNHYLGEIMRNMVAGLTTINHESLWTAANGLRGSAEIAKHYDMVMCEGWLYNNGVGKWTSQGTFEALLQLVLDCQANGAVAQLYDWGGAAQTTAETSRQRRFVAAFNMITARGLSTFEYDVTKSDAIQNETARDRKLYTMDMGAPLTGESPSTATAHRVPVGAGTRHASAVGLYDRLYVGGAIVGNETDTRKTYTTSRDYTDLYTGIAIPSGTAVNVDGGDARFLLTAAAPPNLGPPSVAITGPASPAPNPLVTVTATASDPDGIASVECQVGTGAWTAMHNDGGGSYSLPIDLGAHGTYTIRVRATDLNSLPLTSTPVTLTLVVSPNAGAPTVTINNPPTSISTSVQTVQVTASDSDGIASVQIQVGGAGWIDLVYNPATGKWERSMTFPSGAVLLEARATDAYPDEPMTTTVSRTVTNSDPPPPPPPGPSPTPVPPQLGVGTYRVMLAPRGGAVAGKVGNIGEFTKWAQITFKRDGNALGSDGSVQIVGADQVAACAALLAQVEVWEHEIGVYRTDAAHPGGQLVACGPVTRVQLPNDTLATISFKDVGVWLGRRLIHHDHDYGLPGADLAQITKDLVADAMAPDPSPRLLVTAPATGLLAARSYVAAAHPLADASITDLVAAGLRFCIIRHTLIVKPDSATPLTKLSDEHFAAGIGEDVDGLAVGTAWGVRGAGGGATDTVWAQEQAAAAVIAKYGLLEQIASDNSIASNADADAYAKALAATGSTPIPILSGGDLNPTAPISFDQLQPHTRVSLVKAGIRPVDEDVYLQTISVTITPGAEKITVAFEAS